MGPGLCGACCHMRVVESGKGSRFFLCRRALTDSRFRKYPPIPVLECVGFEAIDPGSGTSEGEMNE